MLGDCQNKEWYLWGTDGAGGQGRERWGPCLPQLGKDLRSHRVWPLQFRDGENEGKGGGWGGGVQ